MDLKEGDILYCYRSSSDSNSGCEKGMCYTLTRIDRDDNTYELIDSEGNVCWVRYKYYHKGEYKMNYIRKYFELRTERIRRIAKSFIVE